MDYGQILYLTNFIKNDVSDREDKLRSIYENAVKESDSFIELQQMRKVLVFYDNGVGASLAKECDALLDAVFSDPANGPETLDKMGRLVKDIQAEESRSMDVLESFGKKDEGVSVLSKDVSIIYGEMLNILASSVIFYLMISKDMDSIHELRWNDNNSLNAKLNIINNEMVVKLCDCPEDIFFWKIIRVKDENRLKFSDVRYKLEYISYDDYRSYKKHMQQLRANLYGADSVHGDNESGVLYTGMGNIVPCSVKDCIKRLTGGELIIVNPETVCDMMNQAANTRVITSRKRKGLCLFCGREISGKMVCPEHFKIERVS